MKALPHTTYALKSSKTAKMSTLQADKSNFDAWEAQLIINLKGKQPPPDKLKISLVHILLGIQTSEMEDYLYQYKENYCASLNNCTPE